MGLQQYILTSLYMFHHTVLSSLGLHAEIVSIYLLFIPILLSHLLQPVFSVRSLHRKTLDGCRPNQHLHCHIPNQNLYRHIGRRRQRRNTFNKPSKLYHLTTRGRIYIGTTSKNLITSASRAQLAFPPERRPAHSHFS